MNSADPFTEYIRDDPEFKKIFDAAVAKIQFDLKQIREEAKKPFKLEELLTKLE